MINDIYCVINVFIINVVQQTIQVTIAWTTKKFYLTVQVVLKIRHLQQTYLETFNICKYILLYLMQHILSLQAKGFPVRRPQAGRILYNGHSSNKIVY